MSEINPANNPPGAGAALSVPATNAQGEHGGVEDLTSSAYGTPAQSPYVHHPAAHAYPQTPYGSSLVGATGPADPSNALPQYRHSLQDMPLTPASSLKRKVEGPAAANAANTSDELAAPDSAAPAKKRRARPRPNPDGDDDDMYGPNGGPKHWTDEEKTKLFNWMLGHDEQWEAFGSKMNTVFRDGSANLFGGRKSFTALKSCFHRNLEVFKQIYAFEQFIVTPQPNPNDPDADNSPILPQFTSAMHRQTHFERKLEAARANGIAVSNLNVKVIDHWYALGWYTLFRRRYVDGFREDPKAGLIPHYGPLGAPVNSALAHAHSSSSSIDPQLMTRHDDGEDDDAHGSASPPTPAHQAASASASASGAQMRAPPRDASAAGVLPPFTPPHKAQPGGAGTNKQPQQSQQPPAPNPPAHPAYPSTYPYPAYSMYTHPDPFQQQAQLAQALTNLTNLTQSLLTACGTLTQLLRAHTEGRREEAGANGSGSGVALEEGAAGAGKGREAMNKKQKAALATEVLASAAVDEEVRRAAAEYLKRLFMGE